MKILLLSNFSKPFLTGIAVAFIIINWSVSKQLKAITCRYIIKKDGFTNVDLDALVIAVYFIILSSIEIGICYLIF